MILSTITCPTCGARVNPPPRGRQHDCERRHCGAIIRRYQAGESVAALAGVEGKDVNAIYYVLAWHGVPREQSASRVVATMRAVEAIRLARAGRAAVEIAAELGVTRERVRQILAKAGVVAVPKPRAARPRPHVCGALCAALQAALRPINVTEFAIAYGRTNQTVRNYAKRHGVSTTGVRHVCNAQCSAIEAALQRGASVTRAFWEQRMYASAVGNYRRYHPTWAWPPRTPRLTGSMGEGLAP